MNEGESEVDVDEPMRLGGRPFNGSMVRITIVKIKLILLRYWWFNKGREENILGIIMTLMILISRKVYISPSSGYATL